MVGFKIALHLGIKMRLEPFGNEVESDVEL